MFVLSMNERTQANSSMSKSFHSIVICFTGKWYVILWISSQSELFFIICESICKGIDYNEKVQSFIGFSLALCQEFQRPPELFIWIKSLNVPKKRHLPTLLQSIWKYYEKKKLNLDPSNTNSVMSYCHLSGRNSYNF